MAVPGGTLMGSRLSSTVPGCICVGEEMESFLF